MSDAIRTASEFTLPPSVVSKLDVSRLVAEVEQRDADMSAASMRARSGAAPKEDLPRMSNALSDFVESNGISLKSDKVRSELIRELRKLKDSVPVIHMTFATVADQKSLQQIAAWLRTSVHKQAVVEAGLQPGLVAGVYVRTPNHVHDLSLRNAIQQGHGILVEQLGALRGAI